MAFKLDYIELPSVDGAATSRFLIAAFGWGRMDFGPHYTGFTGAGLDGGIDSSPQRTEAVLPVIRTEDLDAAEAAVLAAGGTLTREQFDFPGGRRFHCREPGGAELAVYVERV